MNFGLKALFNKRKYRIYLSIDFGLLLMGLFMIFISVYKPICGNALNEMRLSIGAVCLSLWFFLFPLIDRENKDKALLTFGYHTLITSIIAILLGIEINYIMNHLEVGTVVFDIMFAIGGVIIFSYGIYCFIGILKAFYYVVDKVRQFVFPRLKKEMSGVKNVVEGLTAFILSVTAFGGSIIGFLTLISQFFDIWAK